MLVQFVIAAVLAVAAAAPSSSYPTYEKTYEKDYKYPEITVTSQSDERNLDGSSKWRYASIRQFLFLFIRPTTIKYKI